MKLITFATHLEAAPLISHLNASEVDGDYSFDGGWILITGMGPYHTFCSLLTFKKPFDTIWNAGFAGTFDCTLKGKILPIASVEAVTLTPNSKPPFHYPAYLLREEGSVLLSADTPVYNNSPYYDYPHAELVDMEGYATARVCEVLGKKLEMWKIVSDIVSDTSSQQIASNCQKLAWELADFIKGELTK